MFATPLQVQMQMKVDECRIALEMLTKIDTDRAFVDLVSHVGYVV